MLEKYSMILNELEAQISKYSKTTLDNSIPGDCTFMGWVMNLQRNEVEVIAGSLFGECITHRAMLEKLKVK
jgi:hypothetical protein